MAGVRTIGPKRAWNREALLEMGAALSADRRRSRRRAGKISGDAGDSTTEHGSGTAITRKGPIAFQVSQRRAGGGERTTVSNAVSGQQNSPLAACSSLPARRLLTAVRWTLLARRWAPLMAEERQKVQLPRGDGKSLVSLRSLGICARSG